MDPQAARHRGPVKPRDFAFARQQQFVCDRQQHFSCAAASSTSGAAFTQSTRFSTKLAVHLAAVPRELMAVPPCQARRKTCAPLRSAASAFQIGADVSTPAPQITNGGRRPGARSSDIPLFRSIWLRGPLRATALPPMARRRGRTGDKSGLQRTPARRRLDLSETRRSPKGTRIKSPHNPRSVRQRFHAEPARAATAIARTGTEPGRRSTPKRTRSKYRRSWAPRSASSRRSPRRSPT
jgi:hypothetical protein